MAHNPLIIREESGETYGADPREIGVAALMKAGHKKMSLIKVIREKCMECSCQQSGEVRKCTATDCYLWPYRMGKNPFTNRKGNIDSLRSQPASKGEQA